MHNIRQKIAELITEQQRQNRATNFLVMSEYNYTLLRGEVYLQSFGSFPNVCGDMDRYDGLQVIRLDLPDDQDVLYVG